MGFFLASPFTFLACLLAFLILALECLTHLRFHAVVVIPISWDVFAATMGRHLCLTCLANWSAVLLLLARHSEPPIAF